MGWGRFDNSFIRGGGKTYAVGLMNVEKLIVSELKVNKRKLENFKILANTSRNPFEGMRHGNKVTKNGQERFDELYDLNAIIWASDFIREIAIEWINYSYGIKIRNPQRNNDAYICTTNNEPLKLISPLEEYEEKHYLNKKRYIIFL